MRDEPDWDTMQKYIAPNFLQCYMVSQVQVMAALNHYFNFIAIQTEIHCRVVNHTKKCV